MPEIPGRDEQILQAIINGTEYTQIPQSRIEYLLLQLKAIIEGGSGVSDYTELENKPSINNVTLVGNKSLSDLGIINPMMIKGRVNSVSDLPQVAEPGWVYFVGRSDDADLREYVYTVNGEWEFLGYLSIVIDSALSTTSENPVQNKVITNAIEQNKTDILSVSERVSELESGQDGFSPIVDVTAIDGGHRVTITDKQGTESFNIMDGETPEKGVDYWTEADVEAINTASEVYIVSELADRAQIDPLFAESVEWLNETGDTTKLYVLPDGYIYAHMTKKEIINHAGENKFIASEATINNRMGSSSLSAQDGFVWTGAIPVDLTKETPFRVKVDGTKIVEDTSAFQKIWLCADNTGTTKLSAGILRSGFDWQNNYTPLDENGVIHADYNSGAKLSDSIISQTKYLRIGFKFSDSAISSTSELSGVKITFPHEDYTEIVETVGWQNTGHAFIPADYEDRIIDLENDVLRLKNGITKDEITVPDFWKNSVEECVAKIKALQVGRNCVTFPFFSDNHQRNGYSGLLIAKVMKECHIPYAFYGGDSIDSGYIASEAVMVEQDKKFDTAMAYIPNGRFCRAVGNHDGYWAVSSTEKYYYTREQIYDLFLREEAVSQLKHFGGDGTYYYVDDIASKMRFIVLNTNGGVDSAQLEWLQNTAMQFTEDSWGIVFISHQPISNHYHANISNAETVRAAVSNYINGTSANKAEVVGWFSGHIHRDRIYTGVAVNTTDDAEGETMPFKQITITSDHTGIAYDDATKHTIGDDDKSHAIDFVTINKDTRKVNITRLGIGEDREYAY